MLLPLLITHEDVVDVVGVLGAPLHEGCVFVGDRGERDLADDGRDRDGGLGGDQLESDRIVPLRELGDAPFLGDTVVVRELDGRSNSASVAVSPLSGGEDGRSDLVELLVADYGPDGVYLATNNGALRVGGRDWDHGLVYAIHIASHPFVLLR